MEKKLIDNNTMNLKGVLLKELPEGFKVCGSLDLTDSFLESLPNNLLVYGNLVIGNSKIENAKTEELLPRLMHY